MSTMSSGNSEEPKETNWNNAQPTGPQRGTEVRKGLTKEDLRLRTQTNACVSLWKFTSNSTLEPSKLPSTLEPIKQETESQAVEKRNIGSTTSYLSDVELKVGTIGCSPS